MVLVAGDRFVGIEEDAAGLRPGREFGRIAVNVASVPEFTKRTRSRPVAAMIRWPSSTSPGVIVPKAVPVPSVRRIASTTGAGEWPNIEPVSPRQKSTWA